MAEDGRSLRIATADGWSLAATAFAPEGKRTGRPALAIFPAMGAPARIYLGFARHMAARGCAAVAVDPRGVGESRPLPSRGVDFGVADHLRQDWPAVLDWLGDNEPGRPVVLVGHSFSGHLNALYAALNPGRTAALINLTTSHLHYRHWGLLGGPLVWANFVLFAGLARSLGYLPGHRLGWGCPIARQVTLDWARWGLSGRYRDSAGEELEAVVAGLRLPVLAVSFSDDRRFAPRNAVDGFCAKLGAAAVTRWHLTPADLERQRVGHFGHLRDGQRLWDRIDDWLRGALDGAA